MLKSNIAVYADTACRGGYHERGKPAVIPDIGTVGIGLICKNGIGLNIHLLQL